MSDVLTLIPPVERNVGANRALPPDSPWLLVTRTVRGPWQRPLIWLGYPVAFLIFSWMRGALDGWHPYGFLDPGRDGGWPAVIGTSAQVLGAFLVVGVPVQVAGNARVGLARGIRKASRA
ncbi:Pr6Pr family membrane protein [Arthrobacter sp. SO3]|uniref:Pr6Pr family membrane protein n=1 Tax=Arthrobacter sp. SO3 TaxID=1897057 RepID=UPI001CFFC74E|nr:Pr6Pr family membrane protein [Arthrobacter sp. SO3]MCB5292657.1 hypothetical protein [Arthrobacter sp. SO3]